MSKPSTADFLKFCTEAFGTSSARPLLIEKGEKTDTVNGATISALFEVWKFCNTEPKATDPRPADVPALPQAPHDPLGLRQ